MTQLATLSKDFENEMITTRKFLEIVPADRFDWQPHPKSMTLKRLATHIAELPGWVPMVFQTDGIDFETGDYQPEVVESREALLAYFEKNMAAARTYFNDAENEQYLDLPWTMRGGAVVYSTDPKKAVIRTSINQIIHHRAQLGVYLRLLDIPIPGSYGPSADETF
ncbi:DinB family protein [Niabella terrae]